MDPHGIFGDTMKLNVETKIQPFKAYVVNRPWGHYGLYSDNELCTSKILYIKRNEMLSMQYHFKRSQFYLLLDDDFVIEYSNNPVPLEIINNPKEPERFEQLEDFLLNNLTITVGYENDMFGFHKLVVHRASYQGKRKYGRILDLAFGINDEEDIVRIKDAYNRVSTTLP